MENSEKEQKIRENLKGDIFILKSVENINHKPHPYTIGLKHIVYASDHQGSMLDKETCRKVRCAHPNCHVPYDEHTSDCIAFLQLTKNTTQKMAQKVLKSLADAIGEKCIDGFCFVETNEKFRIN